MPRVLSLGAGVQSSVLLLMSARGLLPRLDAAVFADTKWEPRAVYEHLGWLEAEAGVPLIRTDNGRSLKQDTIDGVNNAGRKGYAMTYAEVYRWRRRTLAPAREEHDR